MSDFAIQVRGVGKRYRIGVQAPGGRSMREALTSAATSAFRNLKRNRGNFTEKGSFWALKDINFDVNRGEVVGIIGRNGAGKSTLLKILSRITDPTEGEINLRGRVGSLLEVGTGFHPELTGRENIYLNGSILGMTQAEIRAKFDEIVAFSEVEKFLDTPVKQYSSGMYTRLAFAVAANLEPEILVVDEVLAVGDAAFQKKCLGKMHDVASGGRTVLFISHNMAAVAGLCDRAVHLRNGQLIEVGVAEPVIARYLRDLTAGARTPLAERTDREGNGAARARAIWFEDRDGQPLEQAVAGQHVEVCVRLDLLEDRGTFDVNVEIYDGTGLCICHNSNRYTTTERFVTGAGVARCVIPHLPLRAGDFRVDVSILQDGNRADHVEAASMLSVEVGDFYGTGRIPPPFAPGVMLMEHHWTFERA